MLPLLTAYAETVAVEVTGPAEGGGPADHDAGTLLQRAEEQIRQGHTTAPPEDNAFKTWLRVVEIASPASPETIAALTKFVPHMRAMAAAQKAAKQRVLAVDYELLAKFASDLLRRRGVNPPQPDVSPPPEHSAPGEDWQPASIAAGLLEPSATTSDAPESETPAGQPLPKEASASSAAIASAAPSADADSAARAPEASLVPAAPLPAPRRNAERAPTAPATMTMASSAGAAPKSEPPAPPQASTNAFVVRGDAMLKAKDISAARRLYRYAAENDSARGALALAWTYDPAFLDRLGVIGMAGDPEQAAIWYRKATELGAPQGEARVRAMQSAVTR
jgi:hypothetical protein